jgi:hypothetical protein
MSPQATFEQEKAEGIKQRSKLRQAAATLEEAEDQNIADHRFVLECAGLATGGSFSAILKASPALTDEQRTRLRGLGYI